MLDILVNGKRDLDIHPLDRGLQYGDGLFETILVEKGCVTFFQQHMQRLLKGCEVLGFSKPDIASIKQDVSELIGAKENGVIKILLSRGVSERGFMPPKNPAITRVISFADADGPISSTLSHFNLQLCHTRLSRQPLLAGIKHLNQLERVLAKSELKDNASDEGLMLDTSELVIEGTMSNIFIVKNDVLLTPALDNAGVSGVIRNFLIQQASEDGIVCEIAELGLDDVKNADEIFMTNSLMPVRSVKQLMINGRSFTKRKGAYAEWGLNKVSKDIERQVEEAALLLS